MIFFLLKISNSSGQKMNLNLSFVNFAGESPLLLDSVEYKNSLDQTFTISRFRYYISNVRLQKTEGGEYVSDDYFLIDEDEQESKNVILKNVPVTKYKSISFTLGVDSLHNCSGIQSGELDPANGMFWAWNTGYIFLKVEGRSPQSKSEGNFLEYHIGGFKQPSNCIRNIVLPFKTKMQFNKENQNAILVKADVLEVLKTPNTINFAELSSVTDFRNATLIADNYADMFSLMTLYKLDGEKNTR
jgi:hypothetical protein